MTKAKSKGLSLFKINALTRETVKFKSFDLWVKDFKGFSFEKEYVYFTALNEKNAMRKFDNAIKIISKWYQR